MALPSVYTLFFICEGGHQLSVEHVRLREAASVTVLLNTLLRTTKCTAIDYSLQMESAGAKVHRKQIHTITRGRPQRDTCTLATYNRVNVIQDMWASAHLVFGTWAPQQTASLRLGPECRELAWLGLSLVPMRPSTLEGVYWSSEDLCWRNANGKVKSPQRARKCCLNKAKVRRDFPWKVTGSGKVPEADADKK